LYPDQDLLHDVEDKINEVIDRYHYTNLDFSKIPSTFINSVFKLGEHITGHGVKIVFVMLLIMK